ncbi:hypothetical protein H4219_004214 [Mycoemilia scoparia]|uniref:Uncharacterized protein n=1 Tax=Mycoemilia scoparia TaxID=417184 RepID=A0A9W7ZY77_9FUNG|nr:hypothetical protein H4219_004214 [Mycoemilia scoparia]
MASQLSNLLNWAAKRVTDVSSQPSGSNEIDSDWVMEDTEGLNMPGSQPKVTTNTSFSYQRKEASKSKSSVSGLPTPTSSIRYPPFTPEPRSPVPSSPLGAYDHLPKTPNNPSSPSPAFPLSPQSPEIEDVSTCPDHVSIAGDFPCNAGIGSVDCASSGDESNGDWSMISNHDSGAEDMPSEPDLLPKQPVSQASEDSQADRPSSVPSLANLSKNESDSRRKFEVIAGSKTPLHRPKKRRKLLAHTAGRVTPKCKAY